MSSATPTTTTRGRGGRGRGGRGGRGRGRGGSAIDPIVRTGHERINVGVLIRFADMSINQGRFRWPSNITERGAILAVLSSLNNKDLGELTEVVFSQTPRPGVSRIAWLDEEPTGHYYFNQDLYGEGGLQTMLNEELRNRSVEYSPDVLDDQSGSGAMRGVGPVTPFIQQQPPRPQEQAQFSGRQANPFQQYQQQPDPSALLDRRIGPVQQFNPYTAQPHPSLLPQDRMAEMLYAQQRPSSQRGVAQPPPTYNPDIV